MTASSSRWFVAALALLVTLPARAQPAAQPPSEEQVDRGRELYKEARELYRQGRLKEALDRALEAYKAASTPVTAHFVGKLLDEAGRLVEARDIVRSVSLMPVSPRESDRGREARQQAAALAAQLDGRIPKLAVAERPRGVDVLLDGKAVPPAESPAWQGVDPGPHTIAVRADDRTCTTIVVTVAEGETRTIDLHDVAAACRSEPAAAETVPPRPQESRPEPAIPAPVEPEHGANPWKWVGGTMAGLGLVAVGVGGYLALGAKNDYDSVSAQCPSDICNSRNAYQTRVDARGKADVATVTMGLGGAAAFGGLLLWLLAPEPSGHADAGKPRVSIGVASVGVTVGLP
jgi:hypothetical protein